MKHLSFYYQLKIQMDPPVHGHHFTLRALPISDERQCIEDLKLQVASELQTAAQPAQQQQPTSERQMPQLSESADPWGNQLTYGYLKESHDSFTVTVSGKARTGMAAGTRSQNPARDRIFRYPTPLTACDSALAAFAESLRLPDTASVDPETTQCQTVTAENPTSRRPVTAGNPTPRQQALAVMHGVYQAMTYQPGATDVKATAAEAFQKKQGVCQDFAHVMIAVLRKLGIPARYVTGFLLGEGQSHAWVEVLEDGIWYGLDPTNEMTVTDQHIKIAHGRDHDECAINRGIFLGNTSQRTLVTVQVYEI